MKKIVVNYVDSNMIHEQTDEIIEPEICRTIGYLIKEDDDYITLAAELIGKEYRRQISIPRVAILDSWEIFQKDDLD